MSVSEREASQAYQAGQQARRGGRRIGDCPYRGTTPRVRTLAGEWTRGFKDEHDAIARRSAAMSGGAP